MFIDYSQINSKDLSGLIAQYELILLQLNVLQLKLHNFDIKSSLDIINKTIEYMTNDKKEFIKHVKYMENIVIQDDGTEKIEIDFDISNSQYKNGWKSKSQRDFTKNSLVPIGKFSQKTFDKIDAVTNFETLPEKVIGKKKC